MYTSLYAGISLVGGELARSNKPAPFSAWTVTYTTSPGSMDDTSIKFNVALVVIPTSVRGLTSSANGCFPIPTRNVLMPDSSSLNLNQWARMVLLYRWHPEWIPKTSCVLSSLTMTDPWNKHFIWFQQLIFNRIHSCKALGGKKGGYFSYIFPYFLLTWQQIKFSADILCNTFC